MFWYLEKWQLIGANGITYIPDLLGKDYKIKIKEVWWVLAKVSKYFTKGSRECGKY